MQVYHYVVIFIYNLQCNKCSFQVNWQNNDEHIDCIVNHLHKLQLKNINEINIGTFICINNYIVNNLPPLNLGQELNILLTT